MKVFISQPMTGLSDDQIRAVRNRAVDDLVREMGGEEIQILNSFVPSVAEENRPMYYLGRAIQTMDEADLVYFVCGWERSRGCRLEHECAVLYNMEIWHEV